MNAITESVRHDRSKFIGGSDAAAIIGLSPWATPVELWMQKTGRAPKDVIDPARQKMFDRGHKLEPFIREMVIDKLRERGHLVELIAVNARYIDPEHSFMSCEIDFELMLDGEHINCDAKSVSGFARKKWGEEDTEEVPIEYAAQFMHGLMITDRSKCLVAALRSFDDVDIYWTYRDDEVVDAMRKKEVMFWNEHVLTDVPPDTFTFDDVKLLFPNDNGQAVEASDDIAEKVAQLKDVKEKIKAFEEAEEALKQEIADFISPNALLNYGGRELASWKGQGYSRFDDKRFRNEHAALAAQFTNHSTIRVLRLKKGK